MNLLQEQHTHPKDPPETKTSTSSPNSPWNDAAIVERLKELWPDHSSNQIAKKLSEEFLITFSRNSVIGKALRLGLTIEHKSEVSRQAGRAKRTEIAKRPHLKIVVNGGGLRLLQSVESDMPALRIAAAEPLHLSLNDLGPHDCRYPYGDGPFTFCGRLQTAGKSYCLAHTKLCWIPPTARNERARGIWK